MKIQDFREKKTNQEKITMVTAYDHFTARMVEESGVDCILVGDSLGMVIHGMEDTLGVDIDLMALHTKAVRRGAPHTFIVSDMPFLSYRTGIKDAVIHAGLLIKAGANAIKLEGALGNLEIIAHLVESGIPVMGHLGLMPQSIQSIGSFQVQAKSQDEQEKLYQQCLSLQEAGCFSLVLECIPNNIAQKISQDISIPSIGIGAGVDTDGQVLVWHDLLGCNQSFKPKFLRRFANLEEESLLCLKQFNQEVKNKSFPSKKESYNIKSPKKIDGIYGTKKKETN
ncbi:3-methyl-2-oxobutanoate hydroxymethyltransferase [bacterium]|nr:3-methyl-2-oxobutanoate hydroxymethyltransferase [bacterium]